MTEPAPGRVDMALTGTAGMPALLVVGLPAASGFVFAQYGELHQDLTQPLLVVPVGTVPQTLSFNVPSRAVDIVCQAVAVGGLGGNVSNPVTLSAR